MKKEPIFEIILRSGKTYRIWANGELEGFDDGACIINRGPMIFHVIEAAILEIERATRQGNCQIQAQVFLEAACRMEQCLELFWQTPMRQEKNRELPHERLHP